MKIQHKLLLVLILITHIMGCNNSSAYFYNCYTSTNTSLFIQLQNDFEIQLEKQYEQGEYLLNLVQYLKQLQYGRKAIVIEPSQKLKHIVKQTDIIDDIWIKQRINDQSKFLECMRTSNRELTLQYLDRLENLGDMSPSMVGMGAIDLIESNEDIDKELRLIFLINFYLIWMNG